MPDAETLLVSLMRSPLTLRGSGRLSVKEPTLCAPGSSKVNLSLWFVPALTDASCLLDLCQITELHMLWFLPI